MNRSGSKIIKKMMRRARVRAKIKGTAERPRLSVFRSSKHIYAQLIDDSQGKTIAQFDDFKIAGKTKGKLKDPKATVAQKVGQMFGEEILKKGIKELVFDRGGYKYHGRVKALADGLREAGVKF